MSTRHLTIALSLAAGLGTSAHADIRYVLPGGAGNGNGLSWATAYGSLSDALAAAAANPAIDQIWVGAGTYKPHASDRDASFVLVSGVSVYGGFAGTETSITQRIPNFNHSTLSGDLAGNDTPAMSNRADNARHIVRATGITAARLDGFLVRGGNADHQGEALLGGGGAYLLDSSIVVSNCQFHDNIAGGLDPELGGFGGGMLARACPDLQVLGCTFFGNRGMNGGGLAIWGVDESMTPRDTTSLVEDCFFAGNFSPAQAGGAVRINAGDPLLGQSQGTGTFRRCIFEDNQAEYDGAVQDINTTHLRFEECRFFNNGALVSGGAVGTMQTVGGDVLSPVVFDRCVFDGNRMLGSGNFGGAAIYAQARAVIITSSTFTRHSGGTVIRSGPITGIGGGTRTLDLHNSELTDNFTTAVLALGSPRLTVTSCTIARNTASVPGGLAGGIQASAAVLAVSNTILWENRRGTIMDEPAQISATAAAPALNFCIIQGLTGLLGGSANSGADPLFAFPAIRDYRLAPNSPAIDAGSNPLALAGLTHDAGGRFRYAEVASIPNTGAGIAPIIDRGAHEFPRSCRADLTTGAVAALPGYGIPDATLNNEDFFYFLTQFAAGNAAVCDLTFSAIPGSPGFGTPNNLVNNDDFFYYLTLFSAGC